MKTINLIVMQDKSLNNGVWSSKFEFELILTFLSSNQVLVEIIEDEFCS